MLSNNMSHTMARQIPTPYNLLNNYHQIHLYSVSKQFLFYYCLFRVSWKSFTNAGQTCHCRSIGKSMSYIETCYSNLPTEINPFCLHFKPPNVIPNKKKICSITLNRIFCFTIFFSLLAQKKNSES